jgi:hypothetical protein
VTTSDHEQHQQHDVLVAAGAEKAAHLWGKGGVTRRWRASGRAVRALGGALTRAVAAAGTVALASVVPLDSAAPAPGDASSGPGPRASRSAAADPAASPSPRPTAVPVRVPPLCEQDTEFDMPDEPPMDGPPRCPASTPAGWYASTAFVGNSSLVPFTFTLPAGWRVVPVVRGLAVDLRTRGRTAVTVISSPVAVDGRRWTAPERLLRRLGRTPGLRVTDVASPELNLRQRWWAASVQASGAHPRAECSRHATCIPVLPTSYGYPGTRFVVGVRPGGRARLMLNAVTGAPVAVWVWEVNDPSDPVTREALAVLDSIKLYPTRPWQPYGSTD